MPRVLVADDDDGMRMYVAETLREQGCVVDEYDPGNPESVLQEAAYDAAVLDIVMPGMTGFELRDRILKFSSGTQFVLMTGFPDREKYDLAMDVGVYSLLTKPFRKEQISFALYGALKKRAQMDSSECEVPPEQRSPTNLGIVGDSEHLVEVRKQVGDLAPLEIPVLVSGESGTGKEVVAQAIHRCSCRNDEPFIPVNCGGLTASLIESELFGHGQGAFTGAGRIKHGFFEAADGGTLFLDEIGEIPLELQSRFLRVLDKGEYTRVGETRVRTTNVRVISATNRNLTAMVDSGTFRADLYYRLRGATIHLLPLRERPNDIPALARKFCGSTVALSEEALARLRSFAWPGNVRELSMICANLKVFARTDGTIDAASVERLLGIQSGFVATTENEFEPHPYRDAKARTLEQFEKEYFSKLLSATQGNLTKAASIADMDRKNLREKLKAVGLHGTLGGN